MVKQRKNKKQKKSNKKKGVSATRQLHRMSLKTAGAAVHDAQHFAHAVCAITNPFCTATIGARWPDESYTKTLTMAVTGQSTENTDSNGALARLIMPDINAQWLPAASLVGSVATFSGAASAFPATFAIATPSRWRLVCAGIKISCIASRMTAAGLVRVRLFSPQTYASLDTVDTAAVTADAKIDVPLSSLIDKSLFVTLSPLGLNARDFDAYVAPSAISGRTNPGWQVATVGVTGGAASSPAIYIESYYHYEFTARDDDQLMYYAKSPPSNNPALRTASQGTLERVGNFFEGTASTLDNIFQSKAAKYVGGALGYLVGGPAAGRGAYLALGNGGGGGHNAITVD